MRPLPSAVNDCLGDIVVAPVQFLELQFDSEVLRLHTDIGDIDTLGQTWYGIGTLGAMSPVEESEDGAPTGWVAELSGIDVTLPDGQRLIDEAHNQEYRGRPAIRYLSFRNTITGVLLAEPFELARGQMEKMVFLDGSDGITSLQVTVESEMIRQKRPAMIMISNAAQRARDPADSSLSFLTQMVQHRVEWGVRGRAITIGNRGMIGEFDFSNESWW